MKNNNEKHDFQVAHGFANAIHHIATTAKDMFDEHPASDKLLNNKILPTVEAAYIFGVCNAATQLYAALARAEKESASMHLMPFQISLEDAIEKYKLAFPKEEDEDEEYEQITIEDLLDLIKTKKFKKKPKKGE